MVVEFSITCKRYGYLHDSKWPTEAIDMHHVVVRRSNVKSFFVCLTALILLANGLYLFLVKLRRVMVEKAMGCAVRGYVIIRNIFLLLSSGRIVCCFVPIGKILKPVLVEFVTPIPCYWSLSLILLGEAELMLVFKELRPPVKMPVPIRKALCNASGSNDSTDTFPEIWLMSISAKAEVMYLQSREL